MDYVIYYLDNNSKIQIAGYCNYYLMLDDIKRLVNENHFSIIAIHKYKDIKQQALEDAGL